MTGFQVRERLGKCEESVMVREHWRQVRGHRRFYLVSDRGRVKSLHYSKERILKQSTNYRGQNVVCLSAFGYTETVEVSKLIKDAFGKEMENTIK